MKKPPARRKPVWSSGRCQGAQEAGHENHPGSSCWRRAENVPWRPSLPTTSRRSTGSNQKGFQNEWKERRRQQVCELQ